MLQRLFSSWAINFEVRLILPQPIYASYSKPPFLLLPPIPIPTNPNSNEYVLVQQHSN